MRWVVLVALSALASGCLAVLPVYENVHTKYEFRHSFKGPYLINSKGEIPFWTFGGNAIPSEERVRVCPSIKSRRGWLWSEKFSHRHWMVDASVKITGRSKYGADGMAFWFTKEKGSEGGTFGNVDNFVGLAVILDSFDNDAMQDNPKISVFLNEGSQRFDHYSDGKSQVVGSCHRDYRNTPFPVKLRIVFLKGNLEVWVHDGSSRVEDDYEMCVSVATNDIPTEGFFGISAATGGLSDDHDVLSFQTHSMTPHDDGFKEWAVKDEEAAKRFAEQYAQQSSTFDTQREKYLEQNPEAWRHGGHGQRPGGMEGWGGEMEVDPGMQSLIHLHSRLQIDIQKLMTKVDQLSAGGRGSGGPTGAIVPSNFAQDLADIKATEQNILHQITDLRAVVERSVPEGARASMSEQLQPVYETKALVQENQRTLQNMQSNMKNHQCPSPHSSSSSSCLGYLYFTAAVLLQTFLVAGYIFYQHRAEMSAKKFF